MEKPVLNPELIEGFEKFPEIKLLIMCIYFDIPFKYVRHDAEKSNYWFRSMKAKGKVTINKETKKFDVHVPILIGDAPNAFQSERWTPLANELNAIYKRYAAFQSSNIMDVVSRLEMLFEDRDVPDKSKIIDATRKYLMKTVEESGAKYVKRLNNFIMDPETGESVMMSMLDVMDDIEVNPFGSSGITGANEDTDRLI